MQFVVTTDKTNYMYDKKSKPLILLDIDVLAISIQDEIVMNWLSLHTSADLTTSIVQAKHLCATSESLEQEGIYLGCQAN